MFGIGPAGTGKTYLAAAFAAHMLHERRVERLILSRPALEAGERLGFLPGDLKEKIDPYLRPLYDALFDVLGEQAGRLMEQGVIEVAPLAFMRGRTLTRAFVILDEAQNTTPAQMKMVLTRLGEDSHMVVTGDPSQSDLPGGAGRGPERGAWPSWKAWKALASPAFPRRTWCAIPSSRASSPPIIADAQMHRAGRYPAGRRSATGASHRGLAARLQARGAKRRAARRRRLTGGFTILLADDRQLRALNRDFRGKDKPTNVLSFPADRADGYAGDIAIAYGVTAEEAKAARQALRRSCRPSGGAWRAASGRATITNGQRDAKVMEPLEVKILARLGIADPYAQGGAMSDAAIDLAC